MVDLEESRIFGLVSLEQIGGNRGGAVFLVWLVWTDYNDNGGLYVSSFMEPIHMLESRGNYCEVSAYDPFSLINLLGKTNSNINEVQS